MSRAKCSRCGARPIGFGTLGRHCWACALNLSARGPWKVAR